MKTTRVAIAGCCGRMGRALVRLTHADPELRLTAAFTVAGDGNLTRDAGAVAGVGELGVPVQTAGDAACDVLIEFTAPGSTPEWSAWCAERGAALVSGTTGLSEPENQALKDAARRVPVLWSPNMSVGVNLLLELVRRAATVLDQSWDSEISETHHRHKADAPSGTARALLAAVCAGRGEDPGQAAVYGRVGFGRGRSAGQVGVHALRMGEVVGDHDVHFAGAAEVLTLSHRALSRDTFAAGALRAAKWVVGRPAAFYGMRDVLSID